MQIHIPRRRVQAQMHALGSHFVSKRVNIVLFSHAVGKISRFRSRFYYLAGRFIRIKHRCFVWFFPIRQVFKQQALGIPVGFHGFVEVQVVFRDIGQHRRVVFNTGYTFQRQRMGGNLHHHITAARFFHTVQEFLQIHYVRCSIM